jgi:hypothetical protein
MALSYNQAMSINKQWHLANKMPKNPTLDQRVNWHVEHAKNCTCRRIEGKILEEIQRIRIFETSAKKQAGLEALTEYFTSLEFIS